MIGIGAAFAVVLILMDTQVLPFAVGIYLPITLGTPIFVGGLIKGVVNKYTELRNLAEDVREHITYRGRVIAAGLITGEAIIGLIVAGLKIGRVGSETGAPFPMKLGGPMLGLGAFVVLIILTITMTIRTGE